MSEHDPITRNHRLTLFQFVATCITSAFWVWFFLPETFGKTLEEINEVFGDTFVTLHLEDGKDLKEVKTDHVEVAAAKQAA